MTAAVSLTPHALAHLGHDTGELVPQHDRIVHRPTVFGGPLVQIAAADADRADFQQHVVGANRRPLDLANFDAELFRSEVDYAR